MKCSRFLLLFACLSVFSCTSSKHGPFETKMIQTIATCKDQSQCVLRMSDITSFTWNKMYACKYTERDEIEKAIGAKLDKFTEFQDRIIFMNGTTIMLNEEEPTDVEKPMPDGIVFDIPDTTPCQSYHHSVRFNVKQDSLEDNSRFYELTQIR